jgi:formate-dependent nitrite reductase membrane component NrfD
VGAIFERKFGVLVAILAVFVGVVLVFCAGLEIFLEESSPVMNEKSVPFSPLYSSLQYN